MDMSKEIADGTVHKLPTDLKKTILADDKMYDMWQDITPLARNEWICWVESAKKQETREKRIKVGQSKLNSGMRRPCCWEGCAHRPGKKPWVRKK